MALANYAARPLPIQTVQALNGYTHQGTITAADLTATTNGATQDLSALVIPLGSKAQVIIDLVVPFENTAAGSNDTTTVSVGDSAAATTLLAAKEVNRNGTEIAVPQEGTLGSTYTVDDNVIFRFTPKTGTNLNQINKGQLDYWVRIVNPIPIANVLGTVSSAK